jgi:hypothetical protein
MNHLPDANDSIEQIELAQLNAAPWMLEYLKLNPSYTEWGPGMDYMATGNDSGWYASITLENWSKFNWELDDLNECVHFYFSVVRAEQACSACAHSGQGEVFTEPAAHLELTLWILHPRKGAARGVQIQRLTESDARAAIAWLKHAAARNAERFSKVTAL